MPTGAWQAPDEQAETRKMTLTDLEIVRIFPKKALKFNEIVWGDLRILHSST